MEGAIQAVFSPNNTSVDIDQLKSVKNALSGNAELKAFALPLNPLEKLVQVIEAYQASTELVKDCLIIIVTLLRGNESNFSDVQLQAVLRAAALTLSRASSTDSPLIIPALSVMASSAVRVRASVIQVPMDPIVSKLCVLLSPASVLHKGPSSVNPQLVHVRAAAAAASIYPLFASPQELHRAVGELASFATSVSTETQESFVFISALVELAAVPAIASVIVGEIMGPKTDGIKYLTRGMCDRRPEMRLATTHLTVVLAPELLPPAAGLYQRTVIPQLIRVIGLCSADSTMAQLLRYQSDASPVALLGKLIGAADTTDVVTGRVIRRAVFSTQGIEAMALVARNQASVPTDRLAALKVIEDLAAGDSSDTKRVCTLLDETLASFVETIIKSRDVPLATAGLRLLRAFSRHPSVLQSSTRLGGLVTATLRVLEGAVPDQIATEALAFVSNAAAPYSCARDALIGDKSPLFTIVARHIGSESTSVRAFSLAVLRHCAYENPGLRTAIIDIVPADMFRPSYMVECGEEEKLQLVDLFTNLCYTCDSSDAPPLSIRSLLVSLAKIAAEGIQAGQHSFTDEFIERLLRALTNAAGTPAPSVDDSVESVWRVVAAGPGVDRAAHLFLRRVVSGRSREDLDHISQVLERCGWLESIRAVAGNEAVEYGDIAADILQKLQG
ncbi:hypothetical protein J8273_1190 [Carpediemonas membranifera]|uniref:Uncharacterized protein n=1 Tax=Carpediemonas membranifera TaxID=201153 RepID=A0A8J6B311_9EUKA|nr:hypothetical protein J8273_1190 [Carpediemonas membranifera]|eukprot:KAG9397275.1 hypothetical protein J8273_1190 [Carpediemonas membranifera]